jgi:hypothetical protein
MEANESKLHYFQNAVHLMQMPEEGGCPNVDDDQNYQSQSVHDPRLTPLIALILSNACLVVKLS